MNIKILRPVFAGFVLTSLLLLATGAQTSHAQIVASEFSTVSQTVDGTKITVEYSRPSRRGRAMLFGGVMPYGQVITPGANWATTFEFSKNVTIDGNAIPAGKYSVWISFEKGKWELALDETWRRFHGPHLKLEEAEYRFFVTPQEVPMEMETLTFQFPAVRADGTTLRMHWGTTMIEMDVKVEPTPLVNITASEARRYAGTYSVDVLERPPFTIYSGTADVELSYHDGFLQTTMNIGPYSEPHIMAFYPKSDHVLYPVLLMEGIPAQSFGVILFEFTTDTTGNITGFEARLPDDNLWMTGTRIK